MPLYLHRGPDTAALADALAAELRTLRVDPFVPVEVVVGSRGMERWLRHRLAVGADRIAAGLHFPFPRAALDAAAARILALPPLDAAAQRPERMALQLVAQLRRHLDTPEFATVCAYLHADGPRTSDDPASARELAFAREVADVLDRMQYERPEQSVAWADAPDQAPEAHRWIARLLAETLGPDAPARRQTALLAHPGRPELADATPLHLFGLSTLGRRDVAQIEAIARSFRVHLYLLTPSSTWWEHVRSLGEGRAALRAEGADRVAVAEALREQNALLAGLGKPSRDLQGWLEEAGYVEQEPPTSAAPTATGTLGALRRWIDEAGEREQLGPLQPDASLELHACHGALRQVEALRDRLFALLDADPTLTPRDIVVMTPDIETYAPLCSAVFARRGVGVNGRLPALPALVADLGLQSTNPLAAMLLWLLDATEGRLTAPMVCDLAAHEAVRLRFGLQAEDVEAMRALAAAAGMRWGEDADARVAADQPANAEHTLRFGLERLALGALLPEDAGLPTLHPADAANGPHALPLVAEPLRTPEQRRHFGVLAMLVGELERARETLAAPRTPQAWREALQEVVDRLASPPPRASWLRAELDETLEALLPDAELALEAAAVRRLLRGAFELPSRGDRPVTGAVTVCSLEPMRSVPFRVVALLGMDDGSFPRSRRPASWSPFAEPEPGERDRREVDRHLLLEALLSAGDHLLVFWDGHDLQRGDEKPAAVPIEELVDLLCDRGAEDARKRAAWVRTWPMQPWSPLRFGAEAPPSFDADLARAAGEIEATRRGERVPVPRGTAAAARAAGAAAATLTAEEPAAELDASRVARELHDGPSALLQARLRLQRPDDVVALEDREPFEVEGLASWALVDRALRWQLAALRAGRDLGAADDDSAGADDLDATASLDEDGEDGDARLQAEFLASERGAGQIPHGIVGAEACEEAFRDASQVVEQLRDVLPDVAEADDGPLTARLGEQTLRAAPPLRRGGTLVWTTASKQPNARLHLEGTVAALVARLALGDDEAVQVHLVGREGSATLTPPDAATSHALLTALLATRERLRSQAVPVFARTSWALARALGDRPLAEVSATDRGKAVRALRQAWEGDSFGGGAGDSAAAATAALWADWEPEADFDELHAEALAVYGATLQLLAGGAA